MPRSTPATLTLAQAKMRESAAFAVYFARDDLDSWRAYVLARRDRARIAGTIVSTEKRP